MYNALETSREKQRPKFSMCTGTTCRTLRHARKCPTTRVETFSNLKNVQVVRRPNSGRQTQQNTQISTQGMAEEQFAEIAAAAHAEALQDIDDILTDDGSVDYSAP